MRRLPMYDGSPVSMVDTGGIALDRSCSRCAWSVGDGVACLPADGQPGGLLVVGDVPVKGAARPFASKSGAYVRQLVSKSWTGPVVYDYAVKCPSKGGAKLKDAVKSIKACRPFLAEVVEQARPERVILIGAWAVNAVLGRGLDLESVRRGYGWVLGDVPAFIMAGQMNALENKFIRARYERDFHWALTTPRPTPSHVGGIVHVVDDLDDALEAEECLALHNELLFDVETAGVPHDVDFTVLCAGLAIVDELEGDAWVWSRAALDDVDALAVLRRLIQTKRISGSNIKYDAMSAMLRLGLTAFPKIEFDTQLVRKLLDPMAMGRLNYAVELVGMGGSKEEADSERRAAVAAIRRKTVRPGDPDRNHWCSKAILAGAEVGRYSFGLLREETLLRYNGRDVMTSAAATLNLRARAVAESPGELGIWESLSRPAIQSFERIERVGHAVDRHALESFAAYLKVGLDELHQKFKAYGADFNPASAKQVAHILFDRLKLPKDPKRVSEKTGDPSTDKDALQHLRGRHPFVDDMLEFRRLEKMDNQYATGLLKHVLSDGRIHTTFRIDGTECMPAGELVLTSRGYLPVEFVRVGDQVLTHEGRSRCVTAAICNGVQPLIEVRTRSGLALRTTVNHEYRIPGGWVRADGLVSGSAVVVHSPPEVWLQVAGWTGWTVSSWGRVKSPTGMLVAQHSRDGSGHLSVCLHRSGARKRGADRRDYLVHRLVADAFVERLGGNEVRHLNGVPWDNTITNLAWGTPRENRADAVRHGTMLGVSRARTQAKLTSLDVAFIRQHSPGNDLALADLLGVSRELVRDVRLGKKWRVHTPSTPRFGFDVVESVTVLDAEWTYGLSVEEDHSHVTGGIVTHNTMRVSSENPNQQNQPRAETIEGKMCRDAFTASRGRILIELDQSQVELRVAAGMSGDPEMIKIFSSGLDFHLSTAKIISRIAWGIAEDLVTEWHRQYCKTINFGLLYGKTDQGLAEQLGCTVDEARKLRMAILGRFKQLAEMIKRLLYQVRSKGCVDIPWLNGAVHTRPLHEAGGHDKWKRNNAENSSINSPIQGRAAMYTVASLPLVHELIDDLGAECEIVNTVHDSIMLDCAPEWADAMIRGTRTIMESFDCWGVPLRADVKAGERWGSLRKINRGELLRDAQVRWVAEALAKEAT